MTDIKFLEMAEEKLLPSGCTILEFNSTFNVVLCYSEEIDGLFLYHYDEFNMDDFNRTWRCLRGVPNTNEGFQYIMDLYQMFITSHAKYKKR